MTATLLAMMMVTPIVAHADVSDGDVVHIGTRGQTQDGELLARLFPIFTSEASQAAGVPDLYAYCLERHVPSAYDVDATVADWAAFPGTNAFATSQVVRERVAWIITNSYPKIDLAELGQRAGVANLSAEAAIGGAQYAIWRLTDGTVEDALSNDAKAVLNYLIGDANVGLVETDGTEVSISASPADQYGGGLVGPVTVSHNLDVVSVTSSSPLPVVDASGNPVDLSAVTDGQELYLDATEQSAAGSATFEATGRTSAVNGSIVNVPPPAGTNATRGQAIILVDVEGVVETASVTISWENERIEVAPVLPEVTQSVCEGPNDPTEPSITTVASNSITYTFDETQVVAGNTVIVTATAEKGYVLTESDGWDISDDGSSATTEVVLEVADCAPDEVAPVTPAVVQAVCTGPNDATTPSITPVATEGVTYSFDASEVEAGNTVTVTATADSEWFVLTPAAGWTVSADGSSATIDIVLEAVDCAPDEVAPVAPAVEQAVCTGPNDPTQPSITTPVTEGVTYSFDASEVEAGSTVTVTATADEWYVLTPAAGWTVSADGSSATIDIVLEAVDCAPADVVVLAPVVEQAVCTGPNDPTTPSVTPVDVEGIMYSVDGTVEAGSTVTVTATVDSGWYVIVESEGWTVSEDGTSATIEVVLEAVDCAPTEVTPVAPAVTPAVCTDETDVVPPSITPAETEGVTYTFDETQVVAGNTVTVTATAGEWYVLTETAGWTVSDGGATATIEVVLPAIDCDGGGLPGEETPTTPPPGPEGPKGPPGQGGWLPATGVSPMGVLGAMVLLLAGGTVAATYRRRSADV